MRTHRKNGIADFSSPNERDTVMSGSSKEFSNDRALTQVAEELSRLREEVREVSEWLHGHTKDFFTVAEVATIVQRSPYTVRRWLKEGRIEGIKINDHPNNPNSPNKGQYLIAKEELAKIVNQAKGQNVKIVSKRN